MFWYVKKAKLKSYMISLNSLWPCDTIRQQGTESTLAQVMACCLKAPSNYLNLCWLIISKVPWHSSEGIIMRRSEDNNQKNKIENYIFRITFRSPRGQWVNTNDAIHGWKTLFLSDVMKGIYNCNPCALRDITSVLLMSQPHAIAAHGCCYGNQGCQ